MTHGPRNLSPPGVQDYGMTAVLENLDVTADGREKHPAESEQFRHTTSQFQIFRPVLPLPRCDCPHQRFQHLMLDIGKTGRKRGAVVIPLRRLPLDMGFDSEPTLL
jgi:hypothetical protein